jgi:hypothetical protein
MPSRQVNPANAEDASNRRSDRRRRWWLKLWLFTSVVCFGLSVFLATRLDLTQNGLLLAVVGFAVLASFVGVFSGVGAWVRERVRQMVARRLAAMQNGDCLVHWTYSREEWQALMAKEWERKQRSARRWTFVGLGGGVLMGLLIGIVSRFPGKGWPPAEFGQVVARVLGGGVVFASLFAIWGWGIRFPAKRKYQRLRQTPGDAYIGAGDAYCAELYWNWSDWGWSLEKVEMVHAWPAFLEFTLTMPRGKEIYHVPIPAGQEAEAQEIIQLLTANQGQ